MMSIKVMADPNRPDREAHLDQLFAGYRDSLPDPEPGTAFMPTLWARIEAREASRNWFSTMATRLTTAALGVSVIMGLIIAALSYQSSADMNETFVDALAADHATSLEPLHLYRISEMERH